MNLALLRIGLQRASINRESMAMAKVFLEKIGGKAADSARIIAFEHVKISDKVSWFESMISAAKYQHLWLCCCLASSG